MTTEPQADPRPVRTAAEQAFAAMLAAAPADGSSRIGALRRDAAAAFLRNGLPHRRVEAWHYTDLRALLRAAPPRAPGDAAPAEAIAFPRAARVTLTDGTVGPLPADLPPGVSLLSLADAIAADHPLLDRLGAEAPDRYDAALALNTALLGSGVVLHVAAGVTVERPIQVAQVVTGGTSVFTRLLVVVEEGASLSLIESFEGPAGVPYLDDAVADVFAGDGAVLDHVRVQAEGAAATHLGTLGIELGRAARYDLFVLTLGAALSRLTVRGRFGGPGSHMGVRGASLLAGRCHADVTLFVDHAVGGCDSRELFKTVLADAARGVFQGKILVRPDAQKTDGRMMSQALLLSGDAEMDNKPELEIFADDVQCGHGATVGALDGKMLFYLMSRGLPQREAEMVLIQAFVGEAVEHVADPAVREVLVARMAAWLAARG
ncbi:Fe-S cluster assembly protein SufD [Xanthobacter agilis]|uniref:Fe-S cluster assembly protein SufD n=1 Tax=Xanthobacter agilis TaxID=47492 RepID=A0ABU0LCT2_XANAG|nr:Fe-S cluster assembly protein SufD [Xanthobacter agilis]MDQ0504898.1 Fe-S cluster assembly protein SufD [Xanthobacter agilis]